MRYDKRLSRKIGQLEGEPVPPALRNKLMADAMTAAASARAKTSLPPTRQLGIQGVWKMRKAYLAAALAIVMVVGGLWLLPSRHGGFALADMAQAMARVNTVHFTGYALDENGDRRNLEGWVKGSNKIRITVEGKEDIADDGSRLVTVESGELPKVTIRNSGNLPGLARGMTYLDLFNRPGALGSAIEANGAEVVSDKKVSVNGKQYRVTELKGDSGSRMRICTDERTNLLTRSETYTRSGELVELIESVEYSIPVSGSVFQMTIPKDLPVLNMVTDHPSDTFGDRMEEFKRNTYDWNANCLLQSSGGDPNSHMFCGSQFHPDVRFEIYGHKFLAVYYLSDRNVYRIVGKGRAINRKEGWQSDWVEDGDIRVPGEPQIEDVLMLNGKPGDYCGRGPGGFYRLKNLGPGPATVSYQRVHGVFLIRGRVEVLPTGKVYTNQTIGLSAEHASDIAEYLDSGGKLKWGGLPAAEIESMKADLDVALRLWEIVQNDLHIGGERYISSWGGGSTINGISYQPAGPGTRLRILGVPSGKYYVIGRARITPGGRIVKNAVLDHDGNVISSEE
jgi:outer membrane lipoprotein-sorting protein